MQRAQGGRRALVWCKGGRAAEGCCTVQGVEGSGRVLELCKGGRTVGVCWCGARAAERWKGADVVQVWGQGSGRVLVRCNGGRAVEGCWYAAREQSGERVLAQWKRSRAVER